MLVVIVIISIVASIGSNTFQKQQELVRYNDSIVKVNEMIKTARNYAVTSKTYWDGSENIVPREGYGIYIKRSNTPSDSRAILFANINNSLDQDKFDRYEAGAGGDLLLEEYQLPIDTTFTALAVDAVGTPVVGNSTNDEVAIIFRPPLAEATITVNDLPADSPVYLNDLYMEFRRAGSDDEVHSKFIHINRIAGFSEIIE